MKTLTTATMLTILFLGLPLQAGAAPQLALGTANLSPGQTGALTLSLSGGVEPYAGVNAKITLPDGVTVIGLAKGALLSSSFATDFRTFNDPQTGVTLIAYSGSETIRASSGALLTLQLQASENADTGEHAASFAETNIIRAVNSRYALSDDGGTRSITPTVSPGIIRLTPPGDADGDDLPDAWEQQIIDADLTDAISSIQDVSPDDDFDGDGVSNQAEYDGNTDPTVIDFTLTPPSGIDARAGIDSIRISWEPNSSAYIAGYNIYRSLSGAGPFTKVNTALIGSAGNTYSDTLNLVDSTVYHYRVTSIDITGEESAPSETASAYFGLVKMFIKDQNGAPGSTVTLPVYINNSDGIEMCGTEIYVNYDPAVLTATSIKRTSLTMGYDWQSNFPEAGTVIAAVLTGTEGPTLFGEDALFEITFDVIGADGASTQLQFNRDSSAIVDCTAAANLIPLDLSDTGVFTISGTFIPGDLDGNGLVDVNDRRVLLNILTQKITDITNNLLMAGDLDGNGELTIRDGVKLSFLIEGHPLRRDLTDKMRARTPGTQVNVSVPNTLISAGESVWVPIRIDDPEDISAAEIVLNYDPTFITALDVRTTPMTENFAFDYNVYQNGRVTVAMTSTDAIGSTVSEGPLFEIQFQANDDVFGCVSFPISLAKVNLYDGLARDFETSVLQTTINTVDGNLLVRTDSWDELGVALAALKLLAGIDSDLCMLPPDATGEGKVDLREVILVLQTVAGVR